MYLRCLLNLILTLEVSENLQLYRLCVNMYYVVHVCGFDTLGVKQ